MSTFNSTTTPNLEEGSKKEEDTNFENNFIDPFEILVTNNTTTQESTEGNAN